MQSILQKIKDNFVWSLDTETTGLYPYQGDTLFAISFSCEDESYYLDTRIHTDIDTVLRLLLQNSENQIFLQNAKFDMAFIQKFIPDLEIKATIYDTKVLARIYQNFHQTYSLKDLAIRAGMTPKGNGPLLYIQKNKLYRTQENSLGEIEKIPCFNKVPLEIISEYAKHDSRLTYDLGVRLIYTIAYDNKNLLKSYSGFKSLVKVQEQEKDLTKVLYSMEKKGISVDIPYVGLQLKNGKKRLRELDESLRDLCGGSYTDSAKFLEPHFQKYPQDLARIPLTATGKIQLTDEVLAEFENPLAKLIRERRSCYKMLGTYYSTFLDLVDDKGYIHTNFNQSGTATGRMSCSDPNLQNIPKDEDDPSHGMDIRKCFIVEPDTKWLSIDYDAMEYKMLFDMAGQLDVIEEIKNGLDPHTATAQLVGCTRKEAKTVSFGLLYGSGVAQLCNMIFKPNIGKEALQALQFSEKGLRIDDKQRKLVSQISHEDKIYNLEELAKAEALRERYFEKLPQVKSFIKAVIDKAKNAGWICNWLGRIYYFEKQFAYKAPNYLIQGGSADVVKKAMIDIQTMFDSRSLKTRMILQVHDELNFYLHKDEEHIIKDILKIMTEAYPAKYLNLTASASISTTSWGELEDYG